MRVLFSLAAVLILVVIGLLGAWVSPFLFGVIIPYLALFIFIFFTGYRVVTWARSPVPFRIPTTCGQQKSLAWIKADNLESPSNTLGVLGRMALEVLVFRSLFRNTTFELKKDKNLGYGQEMFLWGAALLFHWCLLIIFLRHFRFFMEPVPLFVNLLAGVDGFLEIRAFVPTILVTDMVIICALTYLFFRRVYYSQLRYISLASDYFSLFLIMAVVISGFAVRHVFKVDLLSVKDLATGLFGFHLVSVETLSGIGSAFYVHLFLVCILIAYFPFSKLTHMAGVFMSPTRNLANNSRMKRHINPWNKPVKVHTYEEWEDEFRELMKEARMPLEKE